MKERLYDYFSFVEKETPKTEVSKEDIVELFDSHDEEYQNLLPRTGFDVPGQTVAFLNSDEGFETKKEKVTLDIRHFVKEYIERQPVLVNPVQIKEGNVVSVGYGEVPITKYTNKTERQGMAYQEAEIISTFLPQSPDGTIFVSTSPKGTTGEQDFEGNFINHPESQTKVYWKNNGKLEAYTIRTDMTLEENVRLMQSLSNREDVLDGYYHTEFDAICAVTGTVVSRRDVTPEKIIQKIQEVKNSNIAWVDRGKRVTFQEMYYSLKNTQKLDLTDKKVEKILGEFNKKANKFNSKNFSDKQKKELAILIGQTVIQVYEELEGKPLSGKTTVQRLSELGGCAGGGQETVQTRIVDGKVEYFVKKCPMCGHSVQNWMKIGDACPNSECKKIFKVAC